MTVNVNIVNNIALREKGFKLLADGLGTAGAVNFLRQIIPGSGNYTEDRRALLDDITLEDVAEEIYKLRHNHEN